MNDIKVTIVGFRYRVTDFDFGSQKGVLLETTDGFSRATRYIIGRDTEQRVQQAVEWMKQELWCAYKERYIKRNV